MIDIPLSEIPLELTTLSETWLSKIKIDTVTKMTGIGLPFRPDWRCAVNFEHKILFTQLLSNTHLARDIYYEYLLAIDDKLIIIAVDFPETSIKNIQDCQEFDLDELKKFIDRCAELTTYDHKGFFWKE